MDVMERYEWAQRLTELQACGEERLAAAGWKPLDLPARSTPRHAGPRIV
jgi:hypothetical protein